MLLSKEAWDRWHPGQALVASYKRFVTAKVVRLGAPCGFAFHSTSSLGLSAAGGRPPNLGGEGVAPWDAALGIQGHGEKFAASSESAERGR